MKWWLFCNQNEKLNPMDCYGAMCDVTCDFVKSGADDSAEALFG